MPRYIVKLTDAHNRDYYLIWSTIVDAPVTRGMTREGLEAYYLRKHGDAGMRDFEFRMERVDLKGTSSMFDADAEATVSGNRAGPNESCLTVAEIIAKYCQEE
jgi:hypothetical protein